MEAVTRAALRKMEDFVSPLDGSDNSNLSPTQENDPSVYIRFQELLAHQNISQNSSHGGVGATHEPKIHADSATTAQDTGISYAPNDTGHLTIDYQPLPTIPLQDSFDENEVGEVSCERFRPDLLHGTSLNPHTPARARLVVDHPGTVMRPTQMFAETQPSPGSHLLLPSSSRPSPDIFNNQYQSPKHVTSSPLARRVTATQSENAVAYDTTSSPEPSQLDGDSNKNPVNRQLLLERRNSYANARDEAIVIGPLLHPNFPEPFDVYTSRKESQERRKQQAKSLDSDNQTSDDGFSDDEAEMNRRAKRKKEEAARELAVISNPRLGSAGRDIVEVPSTGRRRSLDDDYEAQCTGFDERDTQPDTTILDSQSAPAGLATSCGGDDSYAICDDKVSQNVVRNPHQQLPYEEDPADPEETVEKDSSEQLPDLEQHEDAESSESDREVSKSPLRRRIMQPLSEVSSNIAELRTPAMQKKLPYIGGDTIVPETSPSEPHVQRYGDIVSQTPPVPSAEEVDEAFNPFSQDLEFNNLILSPPRRRTLLRTARPPKPVTYINVEAGAHTPEESRVNRTLESSANLPITDQHRKAESAIISPAATASENASEYVTAPTYLPSESMTELSAHSKYGAKTTTEASNGAVLDEVIVRGLQRDPKYIGLLELEAGVSGDVEGDSPCALTSFPQQGANGLDCEGNDVPPGAAADTSELTHTEITSAKKSKGSSRRSKSLTKQGKTENGDTPDVTPVALAVEPSEVLPNRLRSATQLRGSSKALRRLLEDKNEPSSTPASTYVTPTLAAQRATRSSRRSSANCECTHCPPSYGFSLLLTPALASEKAQSTEPEVTVTPSLSTRRRTLSNQQSEPGLFDGMVFSVTYNANRGDEKQQVLSLIKKNSGRVLERGFDELFDMAALQGTPHSRNGEAIASNLTLTTAARGVGFACVIADEHSRRVKFMQALALGLPCISGRWIEHCVVKREIVDWDQYHLAAGESSFLGGAIRSRNLQPYHASNANFAKSFDMRPKLLTGKSILLITGKGRVEERRKPYFFLTQALGARRVKHVQNNQEARKFLLEAESNEEKWNWVYVDNDEEEAEKAIFGPAPAPARKRKRGPEVSEDTESPVPPPKKVRIISDEYVIQSLILGKFIEE